MCRVPESGINSWSYLDMVQDYMFKRFGCWGLKYVNFDGTGNVHFVHKLITMGPLDFDHGVLVCFLISTCM